ncbi:hypothetical protein HJC23_010273 [Cyclotella cryptica]|uniref:Uncharacterized protein n=1 Tax=Cyclotella cryptica TaxID=29204 RepID=A0ABD3QPI3_9STRA|eukprot:CCRYP_003659-RA/>CCRYP_003659-RA protein AED:0.21 eAED:0.21 QI:0/-1/0/1/-1/1/1/0/504
MPFFLVIAAAAAVAHHLSQRRGNNDEDERAMHAVDRSLLKGLIPIDLLPSEKRLISEQSISTISFYEGNSSDAARMLWDRLNEIIKANPWLCGCLAKGGAEHDEGVDDAPIRIWYDESSSSCPPGMLQHFPRGLVHLSRDTPYAELESVLDKVNVCVKANRDILNETHETLFRVSIIPGYSGSDSLPDEFALVASMSKAFGDDYTFFRLYSMLIGSPIVSLNPLRIREFDDCMAKLMGSTESDYVSHITEDPTWEKIFIRNGSENSADLQGRLFEVSTDWINKLKTSTLQHEIESRRQNVSCSPIEGSSADLDGLDQSGRTVKLVSTNEIIVSWFWNLVRPSVGLLEVDLRDRVKEAGANHAGNYSNAISYTSEDYETPERILESLSSCCRAGKNFDPPTILPRVRVNTCFSVVTNHLYFGESIIEDYEMNGQQDIFRGGKFNLIRHMPLVFLGTLRKVLPKRMSFLDLFRISPKKVGCFVYASADVISIIDKCGIVHEVISSF